MAKELNFPWSAVNNRVAKIGVGAYLTASANTAVTTSYTRLLGTFNNEFLEGFIIDTGNGDKLTYQPDDGLTRTFLLIYSGEVSAPTNNDEITVGIEKGDGTPAIVSGTVRTVDCRVANSPYVIASVYPITLEDGDTIEIQIKGDRSFTATVSQFSAVITKMV